MIGSLQQPVGKLSDVSIVALLGARVVYGAERANIDVLRRMKERGARVTCLVREEDWEEIRALRERLDTNGIDWRRSPWPNYPKLGWITNFLCRTPSAVIGGNAKLKEVCREVGATHLHLYNPFDVVAFWPAIRNLTLPLIYRCGDFPADHNAFYRLAWRLLAHRLSHLVTPSNFVKKMIISKGISARKISVLPSPPPARICASNFKAPETPDAGPRFAYMGQISAHKGVVELIEAFALVKKEISTASLLIAGSLESGFAHKLATRVKSSPDYDDVHFLGNVEDIPGMLTCCDAHVAPPIRPEPYGIIVVEAKAAGLPSIVFEGGGLSELVADGQNGIVVRDKTAVGLAAAMLEYARDPRRRIADGVRAKASLTEALEVDRFTERWEEVYLAAAINTPRTN